MKKNTPLQIFLIVVLAMVTFLAIGLPDTLQCAEGQPQRHAPAGKRSPVAQSKSFLIQDIIIIMPIRCAGNPFDLFQKTIELLSTAGIVTIFQKARGIVFTAEDI